MGGAVTRRAATVLPKKTQKHNVELTYGVRYCRVVHNHVSPRRAAPTLTLPFFHTLHSSPTQLTSSTISTASRHYMVSVLFLFFFFNFLLSLVIFNIFSEKTLLVFFIFHTRLQDTVPS